VPYTQRAILAALPLERREAVVFHHLSTDWGSMIQVVHGLSDGMSVVDLAPSERVAAILVLKLRNPKNKGFLTRSGAAFRAQLEALAKTEPGVAAALKPRRAARPATPRRAKR
jgi:ribosomal protein L30/L7E